ncbi:hypothetical protein [Catellatospora tritici]|uniref:hypothetical protein n=1 Tax=Catellatospora tritici TaxID=2851566 RepID=UPI001C2D3740|nr:hypothetical protein [Catellatospora tritici]MBV1854827.1 hypothetical protein [Catellatospora tritici]
MTTRKLRTLLGAVTALVALGLALVTTVPAAQAAPGPLKDLNLPGVCNAASFAMAEAIDAKLKADGKADRMIRVDEPKKGETGYNDAAVAYAMVELAKLLKKDVGALTPKDLTDNAKAVADAIDAALKWRKDKGDTILHTADLTGNEVFLWCLKKGNGHGGPDLALLYVPKGKAAKDGVWIAGCVLAGGLNRYLVSYDDRTFDFAKFVWYNEGPNPDKEKEVIRYTYEYDVAKNVLTITKEVGPYKDGKFTPHTTEVEKKPGPPPAEFKDLKLNGTQISLLDGGCGCPARSVALAAADPVAPWQLNLVNPVLTGSGTETDPYLGVSVRIVPEQLFQMELPPDTRFAGPGADPRWQVVIVQDDLIGLRYHGYEPLELAVGAVVPAIAWIVPAPPPSPSVPPSAVPTPTDVPATPSPFPSPTGTPVEPSPFPSAPWSPAPPLPSVPVSAPAVPSATAALR